MNRDRELLQTGRRKHFRFRSPRLQVQVAGSSAYTEDWSIGGLALHFVEGKLTTYSVNHHVQAEFIDVGSGTPINFTSRLARIDHDRKLMALEYIQLPTEAVDMFGRIFRGMAQPRAGSD